MKVTPFNSETGLIPIAFERIIIITWVATKS
jgi:hypothetical protein